MPKLQLSKIDFLSLASDFYEKISENLDSENQDFYEYESKFDELLTDFGKSSLEGLISEKSTNIRKKKKLQPDSDK